MTPLRTCPMLAVLALLAHLGGARVATAQQAVPPTGGGASGQGFVILLTNDDGYEALGLQALVRAFAGYGELYISAPAQNQSGKGHSLTLAEAVIVRRRVTEGVVAGFAVDATPASAVRVGLDNFLPKRPDLVISGINRGENLSTSVYVSGTLGAAREAVFSGIPAIAVSMAGNDERDYASTAASVRQLVEQARGAGLLTPGFFLNVNAPAGTPKGVMVTRLGLRPSRQVFECTPPARDRAACFAGYDQVRSDEPGTDVSEFFRGYITVTPMTIDVTDAKALEGLRVLERR